MVHAEGKGWGVTDYERFSVTWTLFGADTATLPGCHGTYNRRHRRQERQGKVPSEGARPCHVYAILGMVVL